MLTAYKALADSLKIHVPSQDKELGLVTLNQGINQVRALAGSLKIHDPYRDKKLGLFTIRVGLNASIIEACGSVRKSQEFALTHNALQPCKGLAGQVRYIYVLTAQFASKKAASTNIHYSSFDL